MEILLTTLATTATTMAIDFAKKHPIGVAVSTFGMIGLTALIGFNSVSLNALQQTKEAIENKNKQKEEKN